MTGFEKLVSIGKGWTNYMTGATPEYAEKRAKICSTCEHAVPSIFEVLCKENKLKEIKGLVCKPCGCPLMAKTRSPDESCEKWG